MTSLTETDFLCFSVHTGNLYEDNRRRFNKKIATNRPTGSLTERQTGTCSAERGTHKALQGASGWGYKEAEMNLTNHRPSPGDIGSSHHWSPGWLTAGSAPQTPASEPSLAHSTGKKWREENKPSYLKFSELCLSVSFLIITLTLEQVERRWKGELSWMCFCSELLEIGNGVEVIQLLSCWSLLKCCAWFN